MSTWKAELLKSLVHALENGEKDLWIQETSLMLNTLQAGETRTQQPQPQPTNDVNIVHASNPGVTTQSAAPTAVIVDTLPPPSQPPQEDEEQTFAVTAGHSEGGSEEEEGRASSLESAEGVPIPPQVMQHMLNKSNRRKRQRVRA
jgi:hypothetical protein